MIFVIVGLAEIVAAVGQYLAERQIGWGVLLPLVVGLVALAEAGRRFREAEARLPSPTPTSSDD